MLFSPPFQFTHPRGVRQQLYEQGGAMPLFQFTHPRGVRPNATSGSNACKLFQFTHPRGVRQGYPAHLRKLTRSFNSRTHAGCDATWGHSVRRNRVFQFTHPRGVRRTLLGFLIINELSNIICEVNNFIPNFKYIFQYY